MDITEVILYDHHEQRRMFAMLEEIDPSDAEALTAVWGRLRILLEVHAKAEELLFYPRLTKLQRDLVEKESPQEETEDAIHDHNEIRDAIAGVDGHEVGSVDWLKAIAEVNEVNSDHMAEEERQGLTDVRRHLDRDERHTMAVAFLAFESEHAAGGVTPHDEDPDEYVEEHS
ncbi:cation-binding protein [Leifsonia sp. ku-ls]|nr:cation-binding protein [Leifsonia sp. ku-ls]